MTVVWIRSYYSIWTPGVLHVDDHTTFLLFMIFTLVVWWQSIFPETQWSTTKPHLEEIIIHHTWSIMPSKFDNFCGIVWFSLYFFFEARESIYPLIDRSASGWRSRAYVFPQSLYAWCSRGSAESQGTIASSLPVLRSVRHSTGCWAKGCRDL